MREVIAGVDEGDERCRLAFDVYIHRLAAGIAAMAAAMGGLDALVFTGGVGERSPRVRAAAADATGFLGIGIDPAANETATKDSLLSRPGIPTGVALVHAREDLEIAAQVRGVLSRGA